jgi:hypothetical protein
LRDVASDIQNEENQSTRNLQGKRRVELLIDKAHLNSREKWETKAAKRKANEQRSRINYPLRAP